MSRLADNFTMVTPAQSSLIDASLMPAQVSSEISVAIAAKTLDAQRQQGAAVLQLIDSAASLGPGDPLVAKATGLGSLLDTVA